MPLKNCAGTVLEAIAWACYHCHRQPEEHANGQCLFDTTTYLANGAEYVKRLDAARGVWIESARTQ